MLCTSNPYQSELHQEAYEWAKISERLLPKTRAYAEIWLDGEKLETTDEEPILGEKYLPRKFKTTVAIPPQRDVDVHAKDSFNGAIVNAKTKYTLEAVGVDVFKAEVERRAEVSFADPKPFEFTARGDRIGWVEGIDGKHHLTVFIENGRILDFDNATLKPVVLRLQRSIKAISVSRLIKT